MEHAGASAGVRRRAGADERPAPPPLRSDPSRAIERRMTILGATSPPQFAIGQSDYALLRRQGMTYVDKTMWAADILGSGSVIHVVPRPRRFG